MPTRYTKQGELQQLQYEITNEISRDAKPIAQGVFGNNARHPDMATISNAELDALYRQKYTANDREWLQQEAQRDPQQFLDVTDRIGVQDPPMGSDGKPTGIDPNALLKTMQQNAAQAQPPPPVPPPTAAPAALPPPLPAAVPGPGPLATQMQLPSMPPQPGQPAAPTVTVNPQY